MAAPASPNVVEKEMALTHAEFFRLLPRAVGTDAHEVLGDRVRVDAADGRRVEIVLGPEGTRRIALLEIPSTRLQIMLEGFTPEESAAWLARFDRTYQKGGG